MSYVSKQVTVRICDICLKPDVVITKTFQPTEESIELDICTTCWSKIKDIVHEEGYEQIVRKA